VAGQENERGMGKFQRVGEELEKFQKVEEQLEKFQRVEEQLEKFQRFLQKSAKALNSCCTL
jgi:cell fate (sporulation/competence/biofilm development) regulator YmcA (YheA/YmcA/DUF963 family)